MSEAAKSRGDVFCRRDFEESVDACTKRTDPHARESLLDLWNHTWRNAERVHAERTAPHTPVLVPHRQVAPEHLDQGVEHVVRDMRPRERRVESRRIPPRLGQKDKLLDAGGQIVGHAVPVGAVREELTRILEASTNWDRKVNVLQVTDAKERTLELRALASSSDASKSWDLRCEMREKLVAFVQDQYPESLPKLRTTFERSRRRDTAVAG